MVIAIVLKVPLGVIGFMVGCGGVVSYMIILFWRKRRITLSLENACDVIVDQQHRRIGFLLVFDHEPRWIILDFGEAFADVYDTIRDIMGRKCRADTIGGTNVLSVIVLLLLVFVLAFGYFMMKAMSRGK